MPRLIWVFAGRTLIMLFLWCRGSDDGTSLLRNARLISRHLKETHTIILMCPSVECLLIFVVTDPISRIITLQSESYAADAQADLSLRWAHTHYVVFVMSWLRWWHVPTEERKVNFTTPQGDPYNHPYVSICRMFVNICSNGPHFPYHNPTIRKLCSWFFFFFFFFRKPWYCFFIDSLYRNSKMNIFFFFFFFSFFKIHAFRCFRVWMGTMYYRFYTKRYKHPTRN